MTPLPKRRLSTRRQGDRRSHFKTSLLDLIVCPNCKKPSLPHMVCKSCGYYKGELVKSPRVKKTPSSEK